MAKTADTSTTFRIVAITAAVFLVAAAALAFLGGSGSSGSAAEWRQLQSQSSEVLSGSSALARAGEAADKIVASADAILGLSNELLDRTGATDTVLELQRRAARISSFAPGLASNPDIEAAIEGVRSDAAYLRLVVDAFAGEDTELDVSAMNDEGREAVLVPLEGRLGELEAAIVTIDSDAATLAGLAAGERVQFERLGYFAVDPDSTPERPVFNRIVTLRDTWARLRKQQNQQKRK